MGPGPEMEVIGSFVFLCVAEHAPPFLHQPSIINTKGSVDELIGLIERNGMPRSSINSINLFISFHKLISFISSLTN